jgi:hypothetical protein
LQHLADEVNEALILDAFAPAAQDHSMWNGVEALDQVAFDNPRCSSSVRLSHMAEAFDGASSWSEASGTGPKDRFIDGFQHLRDRRLDNPVTDGRYT